MPRIIVGLTGATGSVYGIRFLEKARELGVETHLILSRAAKLTISLETDYTVEHVERLASCVYHYRDVAASISSGSFKTDGMVVIPCSIRTASSIAYCSDDSLMVRAADVVLKERRKLVLVVRETPLHTGHLRTLTALSEMGAVVLPPVPAFYIRPRTIDDIIDHTVARVLDHFGLEMKGAKRWIGPPERKPVPMD